MSHILGVRIDPVTKREALEKAGDFLTSQGQHTIFTPNPEMLVKAKKNEYLKKVLNSSDLNLCDGFGLWLVIRLSFRARAPKAPDEKSLSQSQRAEIPPAVGMTSRRVDRITGVDFMLDLCKLAAEQGRSVYLLGSGSDDVVQKTAESLQKQFPKLKIAGFHKGIDILEANSNGAMEQLNNVSGLTLNPQENNRLLAELNAKKPDILFVAFGMGKQEKWIYENLAKMFSVKLAIGVGGAFDYISGNTKRAPLLMRKIGLEWLYRLYKQPKRFGRIFNATFRFIFLWLKASHEK